jgi:hypothetical protein
MLLRAVYLLIIFVLCVSIADGGVGVILIAAVGWAIMEAAGVFRTDNGPVSSK